MTFSVRLGPKASGQGSQPQTIVDLRPVFSAVLIRFYHRPGDDDDDDDDDNRSGFCA